MPCSGSSSAGWRRRVRPPAGRSRPRGMAR
jgi:hypothetical protein